MRTKGVPVEEKMGRIASAQHGVVTRKQLLASGVSADGIKRRVAKGALIAEYRGVYRAGHRAPSREALYMAAVMAGGDGALLCGPAAGHLWGLVKGTAPAPEIVTPKHSRVEGLSVHRCRHLAPDATTRTGIPVTTVPRTLVDLAAVLPVEALARACHEAGVLHRTTPAQVEAVLARRPTSRGAANLRRVLRGDEKVTLSKLESAFIARLRNAGLPLPITNKPAGGNRVDCRWPEHGLTVELDSYRFHNSRYSWEQGYRRERAARARGDHFRRYTWDDVAEDPRLMLEELRELLRPPTSR